MFDDSELIADGLDRMDPGPELAAVLSSIDVRELSVQDLIVVLNARRRMRLHYEAIAMGWTYRRLENGDYLWTTRLGQKYTTHGPPP
ncbi:MAG: hypothetical protein ACE5MI_13985 [Acidimicrobiia bacterium]